MEGQGLLSGVDARHRGRGHVIEAAKYGFICAQLIACFIRARRACKLAAGANALVRIAAGWGGLAGFQW